MGLGAPLRPANRSCTNRLGPLSRWIPHLRRPEGATFSPLARREENGQKGRTSPSRAEVRWDRETLSGSVVGARVWNLELRQGRPYLAAAGVPLESFFDGLKRIVFVEDRSDLDRIGAGDLAVMLGGSAGRDDNSIQRLVTRLERAGAAGLLLHERSLRSVPTDDASASIPMVVVPHDIGWERVLQPLLRWEEELRLSERDPQQHRHSILSQILASAGRSNTLSTDGSGLDLSRSFRAYIVCTIDPRPDDLMAELHERVGSELSDHDVLSAWVTRQTGIVAIESTGAAQIGERLLHEARRVLGGLPVSVGVGRVHGGARGVFRSYREARWATVAGRRIFGYGKVVTFDDLGPYAWLEPLDFYHDTDACKAIDDLIRHDREGGSDLVATLGAFLENARLKEAADRLFIHRNTLSYRLDSIKRITGLDPTHPESRLVLEVQWRLAFVRGTIPSPGSEQPAAVKHR
jgi:hypothetical protein